MTLDEKEAAIEAAGFSLRDDFEIRQGVPEFEGREEAYSLFRLEPYGRVEVFAGTRDWAVEQAFAAVFARYTVEE